MTEKKKIIVKSTKIIKPKKHNLLEPIQLPKELFGEEEIETMEDLEDLDENGGYKGIHEIIFPDEFRDD